MISHERDPHRHKEQQVYDFIHAAQEEGSNIVQDFHEDMMIRGGKRYAILTNICAFANTNGGTLYIGLSPDPRKPATGIQDAESSMNVLEKEIANRITPPLQCEINLHETNGKKILRVLVPRGEDPPYAVDDSKIYIRSEAETNLAVRDEIVGLVKRGGTKIEIAEQPKRISVGTPLVESLPVMKADMDKTPRTGVEVVGYEENKGNRSYTVRDLRNGNIVKNVTRTSARRLWHYAITRYAELPADLSKLDITWHGELGLLREYKQGSSLRFDLIQRTKDGARYYFGVTEDGIHGAWKKLVGDDEEGE